MKKLLAILLTLSLTFGMASVVFANPGNNPNQNPGGPQLTTTCGVEVNVIGGGNNLRFEVYFNGQRVEVTRNGNGTFEQRIDVSEDHYVIVYVQGNSLVKDKYNSVTPLLTCVRGCDPADCPVGEYEHCVCDCDCLPVCLEGCSPAGCPAADYDHCVCDCDCVINPWTGSVPVQGGNNGIIVVTVDGVDYRISAGTLAESGGTRNFVVNGVTFTVTANSNNFVTGVAATVNGVPVLVTNVVSLTTGTSNSQN